MKHRALIIGAGRIGAGYKWIDTPYIYTHADAYLALEERVELVGFVEPDEERAGAAERKYKLPVYEKLSRSLLEHQGVDIVSICTNPDQRKDIIDLCCEAKIKGIFCEKPFNYPEFKHSNYGSEPTIIVNYIRRYERLHRALKSFGKGHLTVRAKKDIHTIPHFTNLAMFWGLGKDQLTYHHVDGPNSYHWEYETATPLNPNTKISFEGGGLTDGFMETALTELLDAIENRTLTTSGCGEAIESEKWANEILESK